MIDRPPVRIAKAARCVAAYAGMKGLCAVCWALTAVACGGGAAPQTQVQPKWMAEIGGTGYQAPTSISATGAVVALGGQYVDQLTAGDQQLAGGGGIDGVVVALGDQGVVRWTQRVAGPGDDTVVAVAADEGGDVFVAAEATDGAAFAGQTLAVDGVSAALLAKLAPDGQLGWALVGHGSGVQAATAVAVASDGGAYFAGDFTGDLDLGTGAMTASDGGDSFLARVGADGRLAWVIAVPGAGLQHADRLAAAPDGGVALIGRYQGQLTLGGQTFAGNPAADFTPFAAHISVDGVVTWVAPDLLPPSVAKLPHAGHAGHTALVLQDISVVTQPSGDVACAVLYGVAFSDGSQDFEAPNTGFLVVSRLAAGDGSIASQSTLESPNALIQLAQVFAGKDNLIRLAASWTGDMKAGGQTVSSVDHRSVGLLDLDANSQFRITGTYQIDDVGLTAQDASQMADGSILVVAGWDDLVTADEDIFVARFP